MEKKRVLLYKDEICIKEKHLRDHNIYFINGIDSLYVPSEHTSYINFTRAEQWPNLDGVVLYMTASEAARTELQRIYPTFNSRVRKVEFALLDISPPIWYDGSTRYGDLFYLDLAGAYYQVYRKLTLDVVWPRGMGEYPLMEVAERLANWKRARNSLVGLTRSHTLSASEGWVDKEVKFHNKYFNPHLWHCVQQILHTLTAQAVTRGCVYSNVDSYIFTRHRYYQQFKGILDDYGFSYHVEQGDGYIRAFGDYKVGNKKTRVAPGRRPMEIHKVNRPDMENIRWMKKIYY